MVRWAWIYTTWITNWFSPEVLTVRVILLVGMLASMLTAIATPEAFGENALIFAGGYVGLQVVRNAFTCPSVFLRFDFGAFWALF